MSGLSVNAALIPSAPQLTAGSKAIPHSITRHILSFLSMDDSPKTARISKAFNDQKRALSAPAIERQLSSLQKPYKHDEAIKKLAGYLSKFPNLCELNMKGIAQERYNELTNLIPDILRIAPKIKSLALPRAQDGALASQLHQIPLTFLEVGIHDGHYYPYLELLYDRSLQSSSHIQTLRLVNNSAKKRRLYLAERGDESLPFFDTWVPFKKLRCLELVGFIVDQKFLDFLAKNYPSSSLKLHFIHCSLEDVSVSAGLNAFFH